MNIGLKRNRPVLKNKFKPASAPPIKSWAVTAGYDFCGFKSEDLDIVEKNLRTMAKNLKIVGLVILGIEGLNFTVAGENSEIKKFQEFIRTLSGNSEFIFKNSYSEIPPFRRFVVKRRPEIVTVGLTEQKPPRGKNRHLNPREWEQALKSEDVVVIDTRNKYETEIGKFKGALTPDIEEFTEFPEYFESMKIPKDKKILIYCTGGIRCEKGILSLQNKGYDNTFQLEGGILKYLEEFPNEQFEGECFVFDNRVAVDQKLKPTQRYTMCPHCGQPAEQEIKCVRCDDAFKLCAACSEKMSDQEKTCSKNCAHHWSTRPGKKGRPQKRQIFFREQR